VRVLIAGGGIAGLTLAAALHRVGIEAVVLERASELSGVGAGITVQSNAVRALRVFGLADAVVAVGHPVRRAELFSDGGARLGSLPIAAATDALGAPMLALSRARLQRALAHAVPAGGLRTGAQVVGIVQHARTVTALLDDGREETGDLLVGADGLRSQVRTWLLDDGPPRYAGSTSWRAVGPPTSIAPDRVLEVWGRGRRFGIVPLGAEGTYWFGAATTPLGGLAGATPAEVYAGWPDGVQQLIAATVASSVITTDIHDRAPVREWHRGNVVLIGDAAHPMTPDLGQGAGQAIEDAVVLADCLRRDATVPDALARFAARRVRRANGFARTARRISDLQRRQEPWICGARNASFGLVPDAFRQWALTRSLAFELER